MNKILTAEAAAQLQAGINLVLSRWAALRMAIENEWGGRDSREKSQQLGHHLFGLLTQSKEQVYIDDVEDMLDEFMLSLNTEIEDGSIGEIALKLMEMHEECLEGNFDSIRTLQATSAPSISYSRQPNGNDEEDSEDDDDDDGGDGDNKSLKENKSSEMEVDDPQSQSSVNQNGTAINDESTLQQAPEVGDGWTVVSSRRSRGRIN